MAVRMKRLQLNLDLTAVIVIIAVGVLVPVMLSTAAGIVALVFAESAGGIVTGVLVISFAATATGSALITVVLTSRKARLARRQADFVANVSHELRTPLSAIKLYAQTLQSLDVRNHPQQTTECVATILRETEWLDVMIDRVLTWRASSRDMMQLEIRSQPIARTVQQAIDRFRAMVGPDPMTFSVAIHSTRCIPHDAKALNSVILNLLINAYKYTGPSKEIAITIRDEAERVVIEVRDNGVGLTPAEAKNVFEPFYRTQQSVASQRGGVGLGLAIARYLVERHTGTLSVTSTKGKGSAFRISLPMDTEKD